MSSFETAHGWARSGHEWDKVYRFIFLHPENFFSIPNGRQWSIAHQVVFHGDVDLLKRILALFSDDQIYIRTLSNDKKTLLDVANERRTVYLPMYTYIEHLFIQDELIEAGKQSNWRLVGELLEKHPELVNEKPPYSTYFLLHYIVQNGDKNILEDLLRRFQFETNVRSALNETPLDVAKRLQKDDLCSILEPTTRERSQSNTADPTPTQSSNTSNEKVTVPTPLISSVEPPLPPSTLPYPLTNPFPSYGFSHLVFNLSGTGDFTVTSEKPLTPGQTDLSPTQHKQQIHQVDTKKTMVNQELKTNAASVPPSPPIPSAANAQVMKNLTCFLTQQIFVDPVIASDGQTYEREAITEWVNLYHCSPMTGAPINAVFKDNEEIKQIIQSMRTKSS